jgi:hypothetical protein
VGYGNRARRRGLETRKGTDCSRFPRCLAFAQDVPSTKHRVMSRCYTMQQFRPLEHACTSVSTGAWLGFSGGLVVNKFTTATKVAIANLAVNTGRLVIVVIGFIRDNCGI